MAGTLEGPPPLYQKIIIAIINKCFVLIKRTDINNTHGNTPKKFPGVFDTGEHHNTGKLLASAAFGFFVRLIGERFRGGRAQMCKGIAGLARNLRRVFPRIALRVI